MTSPPDSARRWSLARRTTWELALTGGLLSLSILGLHTLLGSVARADGTGSHSSWTTLVPLAAFLGAGAGSLLGRRVSARMRAVSLRIRNVEASADAQDDSDDPEEARAVIEALRVKLFDIRGITKTAQLMSSGLGHELRAPLQNLIGELEVALLRERSPAEYREVLRSQKEELRRLGRMVENLVALCSAHESRRCNVSERFDFSSEAEIRLQGERELASQRGVQLQIETVGSLEYQGDRESVLLVLRNLVTTAIELSPSGSAVHVLLSGQEEGLEIVVDDSGGLVEAQQRGRIFDPMSRGRNGTSLGQGLSLALTKHAVELHGGTIEARESPLGGMRFSVCLPPRKK